MSTDDTARTVPAFIPGILIIALLIIISLLVAWRSYVRRGNVRLMPVMSDWGSFWEGNALEGWTKPKLWEVTVQVGTVDGHSTSEGWKKIMPLSATCLIPEIPEPTSTQAVQSQTSDIPSRFHRSKLLSHQATTASPSTLPRPLDRLQVSVLISMPSLHPPRDSTTPVLTLPDSTLTSETLQKEAGVDHECEEGAPDIVFGVAVLPWRKAENGA